MWGYKVARDVGGFASRFCFEGSNATPVSIGEFRSFIAPLVHSSFAPKKSFLRAVMNESSPDLSSFSSPKVGVAVSGGPDSMALLGLAVSLFGPQNVIAITIIHPLLNVKTTGEEDLLQQQHLPPYSYDDNNGSDNDERNYGFLQGDGPPNSDVEPAAVIQDLVKPLGVKHIIQEISPINTLEHLKGHLQKICREARYTALRDVSLSQGLEILLCGHHLDDDLCTYFMRFCRYSGIEGLGGMKPMSILPGTPLNIQQVASFFQKQMSPSPSSSHDDDNDDDPTILFLARPLLTCPKSRLLSTCRDLGLNFIEDLSNMNFGAFLFLRNQIRDGIRSLLASSDIKIDELYSLLEITKIVKEEMRCQLQSAISSSVYSSIRGNPWPWINDKLPSSASAVISLPMDMGNRWWLNPGLLMRVFSIIAEGVGGSHLASSQTTLLSFSEAVVLSAKIRANQLHRLSQHQSIHATSPNFRHSDTSSMSIYSTTDIPNRGEPQVLFTSPRWERGSLVSSKGGRHEVVPTGETYSFYLKRLPFIRAFSFGRCVVSPLGIFEASRRGLAGKSPGPMIGITPAVQMPLLTLNIKVDPERRMIDNLLLKMGRSYLWEGRFFISIENNQKTTRNASQKRSGVRVACAVQELTETIVPLTEGGALTNIMVKSGCLPSIRMHRRSFQETPKLWICSPILGPSAEMVKHNPDAKDNGVSSQMEEVSVRIVPLTLEALRWFAAGAVHRGEDELLAQLESIRQCHTADALPQHPLIIAKDGSWVSAPSLDLQIGKSNWPQMIRILPAGLVHYINRVALPTMHHDTFN